MTDICTFPHWKLVAYDDGSLHGAQREITELHLRSCPQCRQWLVEMHEIDRLLRTAPPPQHVDFLQVRERVHGRIAAAQQRTGWQWNRVVAAVAALLIAALAIQIVVGPIPIAEGGNSFTKWLSRDPFRGRTYPQIDATLPPSLSPSSLNTASNLPFGLVPDDDASTTLNLTTAHAYRSAAGLAILVATDEQSTALIIPPDSRDDMLLASVAGQEVLVVFAKTEVGKAIVEMYWIENGSRNTILVLQQPPGGLAVEMALQLVSAFSNALQSGP